MADETNRGADSPQCAAPVFHHDSNLRVVDHQIDRYKESAEKKIEECTNEKDVAFDVHPAGQSDELLIEEPGMDIREQPPVNQTGKHREANEAEKVHAGCGKESVGAK